MSRRKIIFFELNEVPFRIIDEYCRRHPHSFLAKRLSECQQYETYSEDKILSPWVTWPTVHRGITDAHHHIHHFGQDLSKADREFPPIWKILSSRGVKTAVFGSLHSYPPPPASERYAFYVPDSFAAGSECFPERLSCFQKFNLFLARRSSRNVSSDIPWNLAFRLLRNLPSLGIRTTTLLEIAQHLLSERIHPRKRIRRRTYQVVLAFDIFVKQLRTTEPDFATFFTNHVASSLHRFWAAAFPKDYKEFKYDRGWVSEYRDEIDFTMGKFNLFFTELVHFLEEHPDYVLWVTSSMGQDATTAEPLETQLYVVDLAKFMDALGVASGEWSQRASMAPTVSVYVVDHKVEQFRTALGLLSIDGHPVEYDEQVKGFFSLSFGQANLDSKSFYAVLQGRRVDFDQLGLGNVKIEDKTNTNAYHVPTGSLLVYDPKDRSPKEGRTRVSTLEIAPAILKNFSVEVPPYMVSSSEIVAAK